MPSSALALFMDKGQFIVDFEVFMAKNETDYEV